MESEEVIKVFIELHPRRLFNKKGSLPMIGNMLSYCKTNRTGVGLSDTFP